jgi:hypothetical protein
MCSPTRGLARDQSGLRESEREREREGEKDGRKTRKEKERTRGTKLQPNEKKGTSLTCAIAICTVHLELLYEVRAELPQGHLLARAATTATLTRHRRMLSPPALALSTENVFLHSHSQSPPKVTERRKSEEIEESRTAPTNPPT